MSEYWKSTPSYWCKFCKTYVKDTPLERRNHEASGKHQGSIQRSLRELHKGAESKAREQQRAKDEVARLNSLVSGGDASTKSSKEVSKILGVQTLKTSANATDPPPVSAAAQRKAHAEQLAAMGVQLPSELKREVTGIGGWQTVSEEVVAPAQPGSSQGWTLADIKKTEETVKHEDDGANYGLKRPAGELDNESKDVKSDSDSRSKARKVWGTTVKTYPGKDEANDSKEDLDALLSGVTKRTTAPADSKGEGPLKSEDGGQSDSNDTKQETKAEGDEESKLSDIPPPVVFKKRKFKR